MSDLQIDLLAAGAVFVALIIGYNKWQERRLKKRGDAAFGSRHDDALLAASPRGQKPEPHERIEPVLGASADSSPVVPPVSSPPDSIAGDSLPFSASPAAGTEIETGSAPLAAPVQPDLPLDGRVDAIALLSPPGNEAIDAAALLNADWSGISRTINRFGEREQAWEEVAANVPYQRVVVGLQLADRKGPVPGMELAVFTKLLEELARSQGWYMEAASREVTLSRAADLDRLCAEVDFQITLDVVSVADRSFPGTRIRSIAEANGLALAADGSFRREGENGQLWFVLKNRGATPFSATGMREFSTRGLTLALDVPRAPRAAFPAMRTLGAALCEALQGTIADDQGRTLDEQALDRVGAQLNAIHDRLEASGIVPGGALALRLFA